MPTLFFIAWFSVSPHALFALLEGTKAFSNGLFSLGCSSLSAGLVCQVWSHRSCRRNFHFFPPLTLAFISVEHHSQSYYWKCLAPSDVCNSPVQPWQAWLQKCSLVLPCDCRFVPIPYNSLFHPLQTVSSHCPAHWALLWMQPGINIQLAHPTRPKLSCPNSVWLDSGTS